MFTKILRNLKVTNYFVKISFIFRTFFKKEPTDMFTKLKKSTFRCLPATKRPVTQKEWERGEEMEKVHVVPEEKSRWFYLSMKNIDHREESKLSQVLN